MGAGSSGGNNGSNDTQVSGYEREINRQKAAEKAQKEAFAKYDKSNTNPNNNIQNKKKSTYTAPDNNNDNNTITQVTQTAPTVSEVSQATTADADTEENRLLKIKKKGRSQSIISGSQGVTKTSTDYSLGKKSLLGRV